MEFKKENRGGARKGAGRKPGDMSDDQVRYLIKAFKLMAKKTGKTVQDLLAEFAYDVEVDMRHRLKAIEIYMSATIVKQSHQTIEEIKGPVIGLPELKPKPVPDFAETEMRVH